MGGFNTGLKSHTAIEALGWLSILWCLQDALWLDDKFIAELSQDEGAICSPFL